VFELGFLENVAEFCHEVAVGRHVDVYLATEDFLKASAAFAKSTAGIDSAFLVLISGN